MTRRLQVSKWAFALVPSLACALAFGSCSKGGSPRLTDPGDQTAVVGHTLTVHLYASDPDGDELEFGFAAEGLPDLDKTTSLAIAPDGHGVFTFTPVASQAEEGKPHLFDFVVSDGRNKDVASVAIEVKGALASSRLPVFRKPLGTGMALDMQRTSCVELDVEVEDPDSASVDLGAAPPIIEGSTFTAAPNGLTGDFKWCPKPQQLRERERFDLKLRADDDENPPTVKNYTIVVRKPKGKDCPGQAPIIEHSPKDVATGLDIEIVATITDDKGLGAAPLLLYAYENPGDPVDFAKMSVLEMQPVDGDAASTSTWSAFIPNPTAPQGEGATAPIYYLISADDNDDAEGDCDHRTDSPERGTHKIAVTNDGSYGASVCFPCSWDIQCGVEGDLCLQSEAVNYCGTACESDTECPDDFVCSPSEVQSIEGTAARQCIPNSGTCNVDAGRCEDDASEDDDTMEQGYALGPLAEQLYDASLCPNDDDWYYIKLTTKTRIGIAVTGASNLLNTDIELVDVNGNLLQASASLGPDESFISSCLEPGDYFVRVFDGFSSGESGTYQLQYATNDENCSSPLQGTGSCCAVNDTPGCETPEVQACVCDIDPLCCDSNWRWDEYCVEDARTACGASCGGGGEANDCCEPHGGLGCNDPAVEACVCDLDPACCTESWDELCVSGGSALITCVTSCNPDDDDGSCCAPSTTPGCEHNDVEACVCEEDPYCCNTQWDQYCTQKVDQFGCGVCPG